MSETEGRDNAMKHLVELRGILNDVVSNEEGEPMLAPHEWIRVGELFSMLGDQVEGMRRFWQVVWPEDEKPAPVRCVVCDGSGSLSKRRGRGLTDCPACTPKGQGT